MKRNIKRLFTLLCFVVLTLMVGYWLYKYLIEDKDVAVVDYLSLEEAKDVAFPVPTICFQNPFVEDRLKEIGDQNDASSYLSFLSGRSLGNDLAVIDYKAVTLNMSDYFMDATEQWFNDSDTTIKSSLELQHEHIFSGFDMKYEFVKCFTVLADLSNHRHVQRFHIFYNMRGLLNDWNVSSKNSKLNLGLEFKIHYPGQFFLGEDPDYGEDSVGYELNTNSGYEFIIKELEIIQSRSNRRKKCTHETFEYDNIQMLDFISKQGCRYPYSIMNQSLPLCNPNDKMIQSRLTYGKVKSNVGPKPCHRISKIRYEMKQYKLDQFIIFIKYPEEIKVITLSKEVDIHSLIGNVGGYIGLSLGNIITLFDFVCIF